MKLILTSDWQTGFGNLDECEQALEELLQATTKHKPDAIILAGDLKEAYNPIDYRVVKFWIAAISRLTALVPVYVMPGNHDRISQSLESKTWMDMFRASGAKTVSQPGWRMIGDGNVAFLPYTADKAQEREWAKQLTQIIYNNAVLVFHTALEGIIPGRHDGISLADLGAKHYRCCFGGHIHEYQTVDTNVFYIGSPFCHDWGEANQPKGLLLYDSVSGFKLKQLKTKIPHWYDSTWLEERNLQPEPGAYVRSKIQVSSKKITYQLRAEEARLKKLFGTGIRVFVVPQVAQSNDDVKLKGSTDAENVAQYVSETLPSGFRAIPGDLVSYMSKTLGKPRLARSTAALRVLKVKASKVLSFNEVEFSLFKRGLVLIRGKNRDWPKQSNGAGKSSLLNLLPIAMFGGNPASLEPGQGQTHDDWASETLKGTARVSVKLRNGKGQVIEIERTRRPHGLFLHVDGKDKSSGIRGTSKNETQGLIEQLTGYDLRALVNAVYIDQTVANGFVYGTQKDRMELIGRFLDLERFDLALKTCAEDIKTLLVDLARVTKEVEQADETLQELAQEQSDLQARKETKWSNLLVQAQATEATALREYRGAKAASGGLPDLQQNIDDLTSDLDSLRQKAMDVNSGLLAAQECAKRGRRLRKFGNCPECEQPADKVGQTLIARGEAKVSQLTQSYEDLKTAIQHKEQKLQRFHKQYTSLESDLTDAAYGLRQARSRIQDLTQAAKDEASRNGKVASRQKEITAKSLETAFAKKHARRQYKKLSIQHELLQQAAKGFSRAGMPLYLSSALCPILNKAATEYAEIFNDGKISVRFEVVDGKFTVGIINGAGSSQRSGQSLGERGMAGLITAFSVREIAPKTNILALDEPGAGLDEEAAKRFSQGLLKIQDRFSTILVTTHNPVIEASLSGSTVWTVVKRKRISRLLENQ